MHRLSLALFLVAACGKQDSGVAPAPSASVSVALSVPSASVSAPAAAERGYTGSYTATAGSLFVPDAAPWGGFKFRGDDAGALGEGAIHLVVEPGGAVSGDLQGPLGPAALTGMVEGKTITFHLTPQEAGTEGLRFSGTGVGTLEAGGISGEIHASSWHGNVLREATFRVQGR